VKCAGQWLHLGLTADSLSGLALTIDEVSAEDAATLKEWIDPIAASVGAQVLVSDDADGFKTVADELGLLHQVCKSHVKRNTEALIDELRPLVATDSDGSLKAIGVEPAQAVADIVRLGELISSRQPEQGKELEQMHRRYVQAASPKKGATASLAYRLRLVFLDRWNLWSRLTRYRKWRGPNGEQLDGTNNACERAIGWWIKERYRSMRGYKRPQSVLNVSRLIAAMGNALEGPGFVLAEVVTPLVATTIVGYSRFMTPGEEKLRRPARLGILRNRHVVKARCRIGWTRKPVERSLTNYRYTDTANRRQGFIT